MEGRRLRCLKNTARKSGSNNGRFTTMHGNHDIYKADLVVEFVRCIHDSQTPKQTWMTLQGMGAGMRFTFHASMITREFIDIKKKHQPRGVIAL